MSDREPQRLTCPSCGRFIGVVDGQYFEAVPCQCGWQTTVKRNRSQQSKEPKRAQVTG